MGLSAPPPSQNWAIIPFIDLPGMTEVALGDVVSQQVEPPVRVLLVDNGSSPETRREVERWCGGRGDRILAWHHSPPLPSLAASWNSALDFVWGAGGQHALVVNNDVRLHPQTYATLLRAMRAAGALLVTGVGVREEQFEVAGDILKHWEESRKAEGIGRGGPDFSCYLISRGCHHEFRFDEGFVPAYQEDLDMHRRMLLAGKGERIFGVNVPFLHYGSRTINRSPEAARAFAPLFMQSKAYYLRKWGGDEVNAERWNVPFSGEPPRDGVCTTTPDLQRHGCGGSHPDGGTPPSPDAGPGAHTPLA